MRKQAFASFQPLIKEGWECDDIQNPVRYELGTYAPWLAHSRGSPAYWHRHWHGMVWGSNQHDLKRTV